MTLYRSVAMEQAIGLLVLAAAAVLGITHPVP
jgi:putative copper export protein